jgi:hypothetical protein
MTPFHVSTTAAILNRFATISVIAEQMTKDGALKVHVSGDLTGGVLTVSLDGQEACDLYDALENLTIPLYVAVRTNDPAHLLPMRGTLIFDNSDIDAATRSFTLRLSA